MTGESANPITVVIAGGGTAGHVYPGIAIARELRRRDSRHRVVFIGTARGLEARIVPVEGFELELIEVRALKGVSWRARLSSLLLLPRTFYVVWRKLLACQPALVIGVGGYASGPVVLTAALLGIPTLIAEQNAWPGFTNRLLARFVGAVAVSFEEARQFFGAKATLTGNPVRQEFFDLSEPAAKSQQEPFRVLVTGGSQGARSINEAVISTLPLLAETGRQFIFTHQTGKIDPADEARIIKAYSAAGIDAVVRTFLDRMVDEFREADLIICRAGATTVAELAAAGRPAILIPFPFAADDHQRRNAEAVQQGGAGRMVLQAELTPSRLADEIMALTGTREQLQSMARAARRLARPRAAAAVVDLGFDLINDQSR